MGEEGERDKMQPGSLQFYKCNGDMSTSDAAYTAVGQTPLTRREAGWAGEKGQVSPLYVPPFLSSPYLSYSS